MSRRYLPAVEMSAHCVGCNAGPDCHISGTKLSRFNDRFGVSSFTNAISGTSLLPVFAKLFSPCRFPQAITAKSPANPK